MSAPGLKRRKSMSALMSAFGVKSGLVVLNLSLSIMTRTGRCVDSKTRGSPGRTPFHRGREVVYCVSLERKEPKLPF